MTQAEAIYGAALAEVDPDNLTKKSVIRKGDKLSVAGKEIDFASFRHVYLVAIGKAAPYMAGSLLDVLQGRVTDGIVVCREESGFAFESVMCFPAAHPLPDERSVRAAEAILSLVRKAGKEDLVFVLISGGGSAQICLPAEGITLEEKRIVTDKLLKAGADIIELNTVRKHLSAIKGGRLAKAIFPATCISLVISDVIGNDLESIASGPTNWDSSTYEDARNVLEKFRLWESAPSSVRQVITQGVNGEIEETIKRGNPVLKKTMTFIIGDNLAALSAAKKKAEALGFKTGILTTSDSGEAKDMAEKYVTLLSHIARSGKQMARPLCLLAGGELTVTVKGNGKGGRNQEFALAALIRMRDSFREEVDWLVASLGTDGIDGPTDAAGAWVARPSLARAADLALKPEAYLDNNDSYHFFEQTGGLIVTGPTRTNVMDIRLFLLKQNRD